MSSYLSLAHPRACIRSFVWLEVFFPYFRIMLRPKDFCKDVCEDGVPSYYVQKTSMLYRYNICDREEPTCKISYNMDITSCICQKVMIHQSSITFSQRSFTCINCVRHNKNYSTTYSPFCYLYLPPFDANNKHLCSHVGKVYIQQTYVFCIERAIRTQAIRGA